MKFKSKLAILFAITAFVSCKKEEPTPVSPTITFVEAKLSNDKLSSVIKFDFIDGDGDLGLKQEENIGEQKFNVFVDYYEKRNGLWVLKSPIVNWKPDITLPLGGFFDTTIVNARFPFIENELDRALQGEIKIVLLYNKLSLDSTSTADTIKYDLYIKDRAFHKSNIITTADIIVN
ncbi:MAG: hypothetical protein HRT73_05185 [Flavobacteriales bacterium]|nr:hypothetical protein [Flavobacteriales bacterium]